MSRGPRKPPARSPNEVLGLGADADETAILAARRRLAKRRHPDAGGSVEAMQELNDAVDAALAALQPSIAPPEPVSSPPPRPRRASVGGVRRDHPSFTIETLPVVAFEALLLAGRALGEVVDEDPPYLLDVAMAAPMRCWSRLELVPDAGATTVTLSVGRLPGTPPVDIDDVRDCWVAALNELDWTDPESPQPPS